MMKVVKRFLAGIIAGTLILSSIVVTITPYNKVAVVNIEDDIYPCKVTVN